MQVFAQERYPCRLLPALVMGCNHIQS
jgi:hypothetical protein